MISCLLPISKVALPKNKVRDIDAQTINDLKMSLKKYGIIQPIVVRKISLKDEYEVIDGCHRFVAAKGIGLSKIPVVVREDIQSESDALILALHGNIQRLEMNPVKEGEIFSRLLDDYGISANRFQWLAEKIGKSPYYVEGRVNIYKRLAPELKKELGTKLSITNAIALSRLSQKEQLETFEKMINPIKNLPVNNPDAYNGSGRTGYPKDSPFCVCDKCHAKHLKGVSIQDEQRALEETMPKMR